MLELAPTGWEHMAVMVSDRPLVDAATLDAAIPADFFRTLKADQVERLTKRLQADTVAVDLVSFRVID